MVELYSLTKLFGAAVSLIDYFVVVVKNGL